MEKNIEYYRINTAKEKSFPLTLDQALDIDRGITRGETARTKVTTKAKHEYISF